MDSITINHHVERAQRHDDDDDSDSVTTTDTARRSLRPSGPIPLTDR
jgi:hypothetical protein